MKLKKIGIGFVIILLAAQFIQPHERKSSIEPLSELAKVYPITKEVKDIMAKACNDCHSNHTDLPWYTKIQPIGWWINHHVEEGVEELNFDEFTRYKARKKFHKMEEMVEMVEEGKMPLNSYTWMHSEAMLSKAEKQVLVDWANTVIFQIKSTYPPDSLKKPIHKG